MNDIHIRYEDSLTIPGRVFAVGMTMESLSAQSTDDQWVNSSLSIVYFLCYVSELKYKTLYNYTKIFET